MASPQTISELFAVVVLSDVSIGILAVAGVLVSIYVTLRSIKFVLVAVRGEDNWNAPTDKQLQKWYDSLDPKSREENCIRSPQDLRDLW